MGCFCGSTQRELESPVKSSRVDKSQLSIVADTNCHAGANCSVFPTKHTTTQLSDVLISRFSHIC